MTIRLNSDSRVPVRGIYRRYSRVRDKVRRAAAIVKHRANVSRRVLHCGHLGGRRLRNDSGSGTGGAVAPPKPTGGTTACIARWGHWNRRRSTRMTQSCGRRWRRSSRRALMPEIASTRAVSLNGISSSMKP